MCLVHSKVSVSISGVKIKEYFSKNYIFNIVILQLHVILIHF